MHYKGKIVQSSLWGTNKVLLLRQFPLDLEWHSSSPVLDAAQTCQASLLQYKLRLCYKIFLMIHRQDLIHCMILECICNWEFLLPK